MVTHVLELELVQGAKDPAGNPLDNEHQLARQIIMNCKAHEVIPANFGLYSTGTGKGIASVLFTDWSNETFKVEEGGLPSEAPTSESDRRPAREVYDRRVTELWFSAKELALGRQLYGVDNATLAELCAREYTTTGKPWRYRIETKDEFKPKLGHSCDKADALVGLCELVRVRHGLLGGGLAGEGVERAEDKWEKEQETLTAAWQGSYAADNEREEVQAASEGLASEPQVW
jgi:RimJ/RimL family protein N-acetyltransferase